MREVSEIENNIQYYTTYNFVFVIILWIKRSLSKQLKRTSDIESTRGISCFIMMVKLTYYFVTINRLLHYR